VDRLDGGKVAMEPASVSLSTESSEKLRFLIDISDIEIDGMPLAWPSMSVPAVSRCPPSNISLACFPNAFPLSTIDSKSESGHAGIADAGAYACLPFAPDCGKIDSNFLRNGQPLFRKGFMALFIYQ